MGKNPIKKESYNRTMATFKQDYSFGLKNEQTEKSKLDTFFNTKLLYRGGSSTFDYDNGNNIFVELKSRRIRHDQYDTAIIGANKVESAKKNSQNTYWFCYMYEDGLFGIKFDAEKFSKFECKEYSRGDRADYHNRPQLCYFIPTSQLSSLS
jgi:hypothetical protein